MYNEIHEKIGTGEFAEKLQLEILHRGKEYIDFSTVNINRPGLQLAGFWEHFVKERIQIFGELEFSYLKTLDSSRRMTALETLFSFDIPCVIVSTQLEPPQEMLLCAQKYSRPLFRSQYNTTGISNEVAMFLNELLAPSETLHGVLMDLYGVGVMIMGQSGIGKSETALELIQQGHRLVADDAVLIRQINDRLVGTSPDIIRYFMEVRGIGIVDVRQMFGVGAVKRSKVIDLVVFLELWDDLKSYDRLGNTPETYEIMGMKMPKITIPVKPGRNTAVIMEIAARNYRLKTMGYNAVDELNKRLLAKGDN